MKKICTIILLILSVNIYSEANFYKTAYVRLPNTGIATGDIEVVSLVDMDGVVAAGGEELEVTFGSVDEKSLYRVIKLDYTLEEISYRVKFAVIYKKSVGDYVVLLSKDAEEKLLGEIMDNFNPDKPMEILDKYLKDWDSFPGIELTKNIDLSALVVRDSTDNILKEVNLSASESLTGDTGGINPGGRDHEFAIKAGEDEVIVGDEVKKNEKKLYSDGTLGYYTGDYIIFKPHKHSKKKIDNKYDLKRIVVQMPDGKVEEIPTNTATEIRLEKDSEIRIWNSKVKKGSKKSKATETNDNEANGHWFFTITKGGIVDISPGRLTLIEDRGSASKEVIQMISLDNERTYNRISNVNMLNSKEGEVYFDITDIHE